MAKNEDTPVEDVKAGVRPATVGELLGKKRRTDLVRVPMTDEQGEEFTLTILYRALSSKGYDKLLSEHPPTSAQKKDGAFYNVDTFAPALISAVAVEPAISLADATEIYLSEDWSGGELTTLFVAAMRVCNAALDASFTAVG